MSRKLGQIFAVRENTWMIRIPLGCDPENSVGPIPRSAAQDDQIADLQQDV
jgi:hypothetical protein